MTNYLNCGLYDGDIMYHSSGLGFLEKGGTYEGVCKTAEDKTLH